MKCKVCNKDLFVEMDFRTLFKMNYSIHNKCKKILDLEVKVDVIPIDNNIIKWIYFIEKKQNINEKFVELFLIYKGLLFCLDNSTWSIILWTNLDEYENLDDHTQYLLLKLANKPIVFLSIYFD